MYYETGKIRYITNFEDDKENGEWIEYDETGKIKDRGRKINVKYLKRKKGLYYEKNQEIPYTGEAFTYHKNNQLKRVQNYEEGRLDGDSITYYETGEILSKRNYKKGKLNGDSTIYYRSGKPLSEKNYKKGRLDGDSIIYYETGKILSKRKYKKGKEIGEKIRYSETGEVKIKDNNRKLNGDPIFEPILELDNFETEEWILEMEDYEIDSLLRWI